MDGHWSQDPQDIVEQIAALKSESFLKLLRQLVRAGGELDLFKTGLEPEERRQCLKKAADLDWLRCGPDYAPSLTILPQAFPLVAATLDAVPREIPASGCWTANFKVKASADELRSLLSEAADWGGVKLLAEFSASQRATLIGALADPNTPSPYSLVNLEACPIEERLKGPCLLLSADYQREIFAPQFARWAPQCPHLLLATLSLLGLAARGELQVKQDGFLRSAPRKKLEQCLRGFEPIFPIPETNLPEALRLSLEQNKIIEPAHHGSCFTLSNPEFPSHTEDIVNLLHRLASLLNLPDAHPAIVPICDEALRKLLRNGQVQSLTEALDDALLQWVHEQERFHISIKGEEETPNWSLIDLKAACWPRLVPLANALGLVDIALDHLDAPVALRPSTLALESFGFLDLRPTLKKASKHFEISGDIFLLRQAADIAPLGANKEGIQWFLPTKIGLNSKVTDLLDRLELNEPCQEWRKGLRSRVQARARRWLVLEVDKADSADRIAQSSILQPILFERLTPTVFLLSHPQCLDDKMKDEFGRLEIDLDIR
jgi:hypothetical protein